MVESRNFKRCCLTCRLSSRVIVAGLCLTATVVFARNGMSAANRSSASGTSSFYTKDESAAPDLKEPRVLFGRPAKKTPAEQLTYAKKLEREGQVRKARKAYNALVHSWGYASEAATAQIGVAALHEMVGNFTASFREYQYYIDYFGDGGNDGFAYNDVLTSQFAVANALRAKMGGWWFSAPGADLVAAFFGRIAANAPDWERAPECLMLQASCFEGDKKYLDAIPVYEALAVRYPRSAFSTDALFRAAICRYKTSQRYPRDERTLRNALAAGIKAIRADPGHELAAETSARIVELTSRLTATNFEKAQFYERIRKHPQAAIVAYRQFLADFPTAAEADEARKRIQCLESAISAGDDSATNVPESANVKE